MSGKITFIHEYGKPTNKGHIFLADVKVDNTFRCREQEDDDTVESYTEAFTKYIKACKRSEKVRCEDLHTIVNLDYPFPPIWVWHDNGKYYLIAGFHRFLAATKAGLDKILVKEFRGTKEEAILFAMRDNRTNGLRMSYGDWKYCVGKALKLFPDKTPGVVAKELGCSRSYAYKIEKELSTSGQLSSPKQRRGADGKKRSVKRKAKQRPVASVKEPGSEPVLNPPKNETQGTESKQNAPTPEDNPNNEAPFVFDAPSSDAVLEAVKPSSPDLEEKVDGMCEYFRNKLAYCRQKEDRLYIRYRLNELVKEIEAIWETITPQE